MIIRNFVLNKYLVNEFLKSFFKVVLVFIALGLIMNLFEEINFFRKFDVNISIPIALSFMVIPSMLVNTLPFIIFLSSMVLFIKLKHNRDLLSIKILGYSNMKFLFIFAITAFFLGAFTLFAINPITSAIVKSYVDIKGKYDVYKNHLASITSNGIWIKERVGNSTHIIQANGLEFDTLIDVSIYKFDQNKVLFERINAKTSNVSSSKWIAKNVTKYSFGDKNTKENFETLVIDSNYDKEKLNSIYSNLDTISLYKLIRNTDELIKKGYNPSLLKEKKHFYLSLPFFLVLMVLLAGIFTLNDNERRQNTYYILLSIVACVIIFFLSNFSNALGVTEKIPLLVSVWAPVIILSIFCSIGVLQIYDK
tara:strand:- start:1011 stop:2105 length:1095 start_codon:yes stop_codon:yes gene_type:complete